ncbi:hypothetical protein FRC12_014267 [Ceratobasidium sp. 428]|nr:hypothetical protein FRC12_014267 [Ceratobasidium sp. 428]
MQANVLLSDNEDAQLADFGNAALASNTLAFTESTTRFGVSLRWAAPELLQAKTSYSRQADVYSLGMTMLEVISRQPPYADIRSEPGVVTAILHRQYPKRPEDTIPTLSKQGDNLWSLLEACWSWDPNDRPEVSLIVELIEPIKPKDLLIKLPENNTSPSPLRLTLSSNALGAKKRTKDPEVEGEGERLNKRPRLKMDESVQIPKNYQYLISKAAELLDYVASRNSQPLNDPVTDPMPELKYGVDDLKGLLSEIYRLGINAPETAQLESLNEQVLSFQQRMRYLFLKHSLWMNPSKTASLTRLEELAAVGRGLRLRLGELTELERVVARLRFFRDLQVANASGLALDQVEELILRGRNADLPSDHQVIIELAREAASGREWKAYATSVLAHPRPEMKDLNQLLVSARSTPTLPDMLDKLNRIRLRGREFEEKVDACLKPPSGMPVSVNDANQLAVAALEEVYFPAAEELRRLSTEARMREETCEGIMVGQSEAGGNAAVFDQIRVLQDEDRAKFGMFHMPWFEKIVRQLAAHDDWVSRLPWTRPGLPALDLEIVVRDLTSDVDAECIAPTNEACTCICDKLVIVGESGQDSEVAQCDHCLVMFHAKCIEGSCPFCDDQIWNWLMGEPLTFKLQHLNSRYETACELTKRYSPEYRALEVILSDNGDSALTQLIIKFIKQLSRQKSPDPGAAIPQIRHFMRKLHRIQLEISARPEVFAYGLSLAHLHRQMAMQPQTKHMMCQKPKFVFEPEMVSEASDGSRCLCSGTECHPWSKRKLRCNRCQSSYHEACIALSMAAQVPMPFVCPLCLLKEGKTYGPAEVRVTYHDNYSEENAKFVDVKACLDNYSWNVIRRALPPPARETIYVELFLFVPGTNPSVEVSEHHPNPYGETSAKLAAQQCSEENSSTDEDFGSNHADFGHDEEHSSDKDSTTAVVGAVKEQADCSCTTCLWRPPVPRLPPWRPLGPLHRV